MVSRSTPILGVALDGAGAHPAAWRWPDAAAGLLEPTRLVGLARTAERGQLDLVSLHDSFDAPDPTLGELPFRLDALLSLAHVAAATTTIGLLATVTTTHTEPFHVSKNVATLDLVSAGRGAWRVAVSTTDEAARRFGRREPSPPDDLLAEAEEAVEVVRRLWDSWEDDAVIRDQPTGRYVDRDKLHYVDFDGRFFGVRGPSITPRPPQGQPIVAVDIDGPESVSLAARLGDVALVVATDAGSAAGQRDTVRAAAEAAGRDPDEVRVVALARIGERHCRDELDALAGVGASFGGLDLVGRADDVADAIAGWFEAGAVDGFLLQPDLLPVTLDWIVDEVVPLLRSRGLVDDVVPGSTLRDRFGLARPANRYASAEAVP
jgi:alkanesulfonate monooxygenase SsuD/methylene tetrahydromethanopterin reductase-like flavin-dependent oxidoreductase (luciferase family)